MRLSVYPICFLAFLTASGELFLRFKGLDNPKFAFDWVYHPVLGHTGPYSEVVKRGKAENFYSELGFRSDWLKTPAPEPSHFTLMILGDSMTEANDIEREKTYVGTLRELLKGRKPRIHTFASSDYGTLDEALALNKFKDSVQPSAVVLQFLGLNDFINNTLAYAEKNKAESDFSRAYVIPEGSSESPSFHLGELPLTYSSKLRSWWLAHSALFRLYYARKTARIWEYAMVHGYPEQDCPAELQLFLEEPDDGWKEGIEVTGRILKQIRAEAGKVPVLGVYFPSNIETDDKLWQEGIVPKLEHCFPGRKYGRHIGEKRFLGLASAAGLKAISLWEAFKKAAPKRTEATLYIPGGHYSPAGHMVTAREIARHL